MQVNELNAEYKYLNLDVTRFIFGKHIQMNKSKINPILPKTSIELFGEIGFADIVIATRQVPKDINLSTNIISNSKIIPTLTVGLLDFNDNCKNESTLKDISDFLIQKANSLSLNTVIITINNSDFLLENLPRLGYFLFGNNQFALNFF
jgi:hypothetical protein